ncbi:MAG: LytTR family transcriptional regulator [Balneola sp.]|nr:MAG: LytTR family transcriptional regulator [Balneola sp.]
MSRVIPHIASKLKTIGIVVFLVWIGVYIYMLSNPHYSVVLTLLIALCFGLISGGIVLFYEILLFIINQRTKRSVNSTIVTTLIITTIAIANYIFYLVLSNSEATAQGFLTLTVLTLIIAILPILGAYLFEKNQALSTRLNEVTPIVDQLDGDLPKSVTRWTIKLNKSDSRNINIEALLYVESKKNYLVFHCESNHTFQLRFTLKQLEASLSKFDYLIRCHRSFLVNAKKIREVKPSGNGYTLTLDSGDSKIPVSKTYADNLKSWASI